MEERKRSPLIRPLVVLLSFGMLMLLWFLATRNPEKNPPPAWAAILTAVGGAIVFAYVLPLIVRLAPSEVRLAEQGIFRIMGTHAKFWAYRDIERIEIASREMGGECISVLAVSTGGGRTAMIGIAPSVSLDELEALLSGRGISVSREEPPPPERRSWGAAER